MDYAQGAGGFARNDGLALDWARKAYQEGDPDGEAVYGFLLATHRTGGVPYKPPANAKGLDRLDQNGLRLLRDSVSNCSALGADFLATAYTSVGNYEAAYILLKAGSQADDPLPIIVQDFPSAQGRLTPDQIAAADPVAGQYRVVDYSDYQAADAAAAESAQAADVPAPPGGAPPPDTSLAHAAGGLAQTEAMLSDNAGDQSGARSNQPSDVASRLAARAHVESATPSNATLVRLFRVAYRNFGQYLVDTPPGELMRNEGDNMGGGAAGLDQSGARLVTGFMTALGGGNVMRTQGVQFVNWADTAIIAIKSREYFEGNWVVYLTVRPRGQDKYATEKMVVTRQGDQWVASLPEAQSILPH